MRSLLLEGIIRFSQYTSRGNSKVSFNVLSEKFVEAGPNRKTESDHEATGLDDFLVRFPFNLVTELEGKNVLDFGCGYGGKAVELASRVPTATVTGIDQHQKKVDRAADYASRRGIANANFRICTQDRIPLEDESVDAVVCHDVMEHVHDPATTLRELHRVLRGGGKAFIVFPPYEGPVSHHLDFITTFPGLHWFWSPDTIMETVNHLLSSEYGKRFRTPPQPSPTYSITAGKRVLPSLNGLGTETLAELTAPYFKVGQTERLTLIDRLVKLRVPARVRSALKEKALRTLSGRAIDRMTITMSVVLERLA